MERALTYADLEKIMSLADAIEAMPNERRDHADRYQVAQVWGEPYRRVNIYMYELAEMNCDPDFDW